MYDKPMKEESNLLVYVVNVPRNILEGYINMRCTQRQEGTQGRCKEESSDCDPLCFQGFVNTQISYLFKI